MTFGGYLHLTRLELMDDIECTNPKCGWYGGVDELVCSDEDASKSVAESKFNRCPRCGGEDFEDLDEKS